MAETRLTIRLDAKLRQKLRQLARAHGKKPSQLVREALEAYCNGAEKDSTCYDIALKAGFIGSAKNLPPDASTNRRYMEGFGKSR